MRQARRIDPYLLPLLSNEQVDADLKMELAEMQTRKETRTKAISRFFLGTQGTQRRLNSFPLARPNERSTLDILTPFRPGLAESHHSSLATRDGLSASTS
jgi:hypothetical protein